MRGTLCIQAAVLLGIAAVAASHKHVGCGVDDPAFASVVNAPSVTVAQTYHEGEAIRRLAEQGGRALTGGFVPLSTLHQQGLSGKIRIGLVWDPVDKGDFTTQSNNCGGPCQVVPKQCSYMGQSIYVLNAASQEVQASNFCEEQHLVTGAAGAARGSAMRRRTEDAMNYWRKTLYVRPVQNPSIVISNSLVQTYNLTATNVSNVDLVIIMTARPSPNRPVAGYASCGQRDQYNRCTVGIFNWVPEILDVENHDAADVTTSELHTALHEIMHVLGGMHPGTSASNSPFIDDNGNNVDPKGNVFRTTADPAYPGKQVTKIVTPRVVNVTRVGFDCPTADGFPLEDVDLGKGAHWEARLAGPELMSYGTGSGQTYVSDLTLAYLEDTNQYIANYTNAGKLTPEITDDFKLSGISFLMASGGSGSYTPPPAPSPGMLTWGRGQGCDFINSHPRTGWPEEYLCSKNQDYGCTADNRMSAACIVQASYTREASCGSWYIDQTTGSMTCGTNNVAAGSGYSIATTMRYYTTDADAAAASDVTTATTAVTGGFSNAMDFVPVQVGYWDCTTAIPVGNTTAGNEGSTAGFQNFAGLFGSATDMMKFGGQARCPECRCMKSSLMELTRTVTPTFSVYGLCYRTNCYRSDYLQVAIRGQFGKNTVYWYKCPASGGKVYITGFTGSIHCPAAESFCAMETVTGIKYPEQNFVYEAVFWGTITGVALIFLAVCAFPCCRDPIIRFFKRICGALQFATEYEDVQEPVGATGKARHVIRVKSGVYDPKTERARAEEASRRAARARARKAAKGVVSSEPDDEQQGPPVKDTLPCTCASATLISINTLTLLTGLAMVGLVIWAIYAARALANAIPILGVATLIACVGIVGICAGRRRAVVSGGPSCWLLAYFAFNVTICLLLIWVIAYNFAYTNWRAYVDTNWDTISDFLPAKYRAGSTRAEQIDSAVQTVKNNITVLAAMGASVLAIFLAALFSAARLMHIHTLASMLLTMCNNLLMAGGVLLATVGFYLIAASGRAANVVVVVAVVIAVGLVGLVIGILGSIAVFRKSLIAMGMYLTVLIGLAGFCGYAMWLFITQSGKISGYVNDLDDDAIANIANDLGLTTSKADLIIRLQDNLNQLALATAVTAGIVVLLFVSGIIYYTAVAGERKAAAAAAAGITLNKPAGGGGKGTPKPQIQTPASPSAPVATPVRAVAPAGASAVAVRPMPMQPVQYAVGGVPHHPLAAAAGALGSSAVPIVFDPTVRAGGAVGGGGAPVAGMYYTHPAMAAAGMHPAQPQMAVSPAGGMRPIMGPNGQVLMVRPVSGSPPTGVYPNMAAAVPPGAMHVQYM